MSASDEFREEWVAECDANENTVYCELKKRFPRLLKEVTEARGVLVLPRNETLPASLTRAFLESHILRPSPYFKEQFLSWGKAKDCGVENRDGIYLITIGRGWRCACKVRIIKQERLYSTSGGDLRVFFVNEHFFALENQLNAMMANKSGPNASRQNITLNPIKHIQDVGRLQEVLGFDISALTKGVATAFLKSYVLLPGCTAEAAERIQQLYTECTERVVEKIAGDETKLVDFSPSSATGQRNREVCLIAASHSVAVVLLPKFFPYWLTDHKEYDITLTNATTALRSSWTYKAFVKNLSESEANPFHLVDPRDLEPISRTLADIYNVPERVTPLGFMTLMHTTLERIKGILPKKDQKEICADDLLPALAYTIVRAEVPHLEATLSYVMNLTAEPMLHSEMGYALTTFQAAVGIISSMGGNEGGGDGDGMRLIGDSIEELRQRFGEGGGEKGAPVHTLRKETERKVASPRGVNSTPPGAFQNGRSGYGGGFGGGGFGGSGGSSYNRQSNATNGTPSNGKKSLLEPRASLLDDEPERRISIKTSIDVDEAKPVGDFLSSLLDK